MKKIFFSIIFSTFTLFPQVITEISNRQSRIGHLKRELEKEKKTLRSLVHSNTASKELIKLIEDIQQKMLSLEDHTGRLDPDGKSITQLRHKELKLQYEACIEQQKNPSIQKLTHEMDALRKEIDIHTIHEKQEIDKVAQQLEEDHSNKDLNKQMKDLQKKIKEKIEQHKPRMEVLQKEIETIMASFIEKGRVLRKEIQRKYQAIEHKRSRLDKQLSLLVDELTTALKPQQKEIQYARERILKIREQLFKLEPCVKPSVVFTPHWEIFFIPG